MAEDAQRDSLVVVNKFAEIERAAVWLERFTATSAVPPDITSKLQVVIDEVLNNVFSHAFAGSAEGKRQVGLSLRRDSVGVALEVTDDGPAFNPVLASVEPEGTRISERRPGGVGLVFVRALIDDVRFVREGGRNQLVMTMRMPAVAR